MAEHRQDNAVVPAPLMDVTRMVQTMVEGMFQDVNLDEQMQKAIERCLHDQKGKLQLMLAGVLMQKMLGYAKHAAAEEYGRHLMEDPEYMMRLRPDPEILRKHVESIHKMNQGGEKFFAEMLKNLLDSSRGGGGASFDPQQQFNFLFAEGSTGLVGLPEQLQDRNKRRQFQERAAQAMSLLRDDVPAPPKVRRRLRGVEDEEVIDAEVVEIKSEPTPPPAPQAPDAEPDDDAFWEAMGVKEDE